MAIAIEAFIIVHVVDFCASMLSLTTVCNLISAISLKWTAHK
jgi:hypothetical protein